MRQVLIALGLLALGSTLEAQQPPKLNLPTANWRLEPCSFGTTVAEFAFALGVPIGFEATPDCWLSPRGFQPQELAGVPEESTLTQGLDHLITLVPTYSWREVGGVPVVRPKVAWDDPTNVLNLPTKPFEAADMPLDQIVHMALQATTPTVSLPHQNIARERSINRSSSVVFAGGTMLEALNAIVRAHGGIDWQLGYGSGRATLAMSAPDPTEGVVMAPIAVPQVR